MLADSYIQRKAFSLHLDFKDSLEVAEVSLRDFKAAVERNSFRMHVLIKHAVSPEIGCVALDGLVAQIS